MLFEGIPPESSVVAEGGPGDPFLESPQGTYDVRLCKSHWFPVKAVGSTVGLQRGIL